MCAQTPVFMGLHGIDEREPPLLESAPQSKLLLARNSECASPNRKRFVDRRVSGG
jgi:hypothetical protein